MKLDKKTMLRIFLIAAAGIFLYWLLCEMDKVAVILGGIAKIASPFITGGIIAFILNVPMRAFERMFKKVKNPNVRRSLAIVLTILCVLIVVALVCVLLIPQLIVAIIQLGSTFENLPDWISDAGKKLIRRYPEIHAWISNNIDASNTNWGDIVKNIFPKIGDIATSVINMVSSLASGVVNFFLAIVFSVYCLYNKDVLARQGRKVLYAFFPEKFSDRVVRVLRLSNVTFSNFLSGQCVEACILGCMFAVVMAIFKLPYIPLICILITVTAFIPIVGALLGCFVGALLIALDPSAGPIDAIYFIIISVVVQQLENNLIYPRVVGTSIGLPGMWVLVAVTVGGAVMGVGGMFIMIPLSSVIYSVIRLYTNKKLKRVNVDPEKLRCHPMDMSKGKRKDNPKTPEEIVDEP